VGAMSDQDVYTLVSDSIYQIHKVFAHYAVHSDEGYLKLTSSAVFCWSHSSITLLPNFLWISIFFYYFICVLCRRLLL